MHAKAFEQESLPIGEKKVAGDVLGGNLRESAWAFFLKLSIGVVDVIRIHLKAKDHPITRFNLDPFAFAKASRSIHRTHIDLIDRMRTGWGGDQDSEKYHKAHRSTLLLSAVALEKDLLLGIYIAQIVLVLMLDHDASDGSRSLTLPEE